jgi:hypothetical protein
MVHRKCLLETVAILLSSAEVLELLSENGRCALRHPILRGYLSDFPQRHVEVRSLFSAQPSFDQS